jgi:hypothetical protein
MGILVEFNPDLALRHIEEFRKGNRQKAECIPEPLEEGKEYPFLKLGQRNYWLLGELPLLETKGNGHLSRPKASIVIKEAKHSLKGKEIWTEGTYEVIAVFSDEKPHFDGFERIR